MDADGLILWTPDGQALAPTAGPMGADKEDMLIYLSRFEYREPDAPKEGATVHPSLIPPKNPNLN